MLLVSLMLSRECQNRKANLCERDVRICCSSEHPKQRCLPRIGTAPAETPSSGATLHAASLPHADTLFAHVSLLAHQPHQAGTVGDICLRSLLDGTGQGLRDGKSDVDPHRLVRLPYIVFGRMPLPVSIPRECCQLTRALLPPFQLNRGRRISSTKSTCFTCSRRLKKNWH